MRGSITLGRPAFEHNSERYRTICECLRVEFIPEHREHPATWGIMVEGDS